MSPEAQQRFMKEVVTPEMGKSFRAYDGSRFAKFSCETCHGSGAQRGNFHMPNPELPELDPTGDFAEARAHDAAMVEFMKKTVTPNLARLLGEPLYDPASRKGFGCGGCHPMTSD